MIVWVASPKGLCWLSLSSSCFSLNVARDGLVCHSAVPLLAKLEIGLPVFGLYTCLSGLLFALVLVLVCISI